MLRSREVTFAVVETDAGLRGVGYTFSRAGDVAGAIERNLKGLLLNEDALLTEKLWEKMYYGTSFLGRKGLLMRAISAVDIALWDLKAQVAELPLYRLLGGYQDAVPAMMAGGFYVEGKNLGELAAEVEGYVKEGFRAIKIVFGAGRFRDDLERLRTVREAVGPEIKLAVDLHWSWASAKQALKPARQMEVYDLDFIEDPFRPDNLAALSEFAAGLSTPVAVGEMESGRWTFLELLTRKAADILRCDATVVGGVSEWLKIAALASAYGVPVLPHYFPEIHVHLAAGTANSLAVEFIAPESVNFHAILHEPLQVRNGWVRAPEVPGLGIQWNWQAIDRLRV